MVYAYRAIETVNDHKNDGTYKCNASAQTLKVTVNDHKNDGTYKTKKHRCSRTDTVNDHKNDGTYKSAALARLVSATVNDHKNDGTYKIPPTWMDNTKTVNDHKNDGTYKCCKQTQFNNITVNDHKNDGTYKTHQYSAELEGVVNGRKMITKVEIKHIDELGKASRVIRKLGYEPDELMCDDRPDIVLPSKTNRKIGIEVVNYSTHRYEESESVLYKMFNEYIEERLDKRSEKRYEIGVMFANLDIPVDINYKQVKKRLFNEIDNFLLPHQPPMNHQYIESVTAWENPGVYNPQNEMFRKNKMKRSAPQNEMFLFRVPSPQRKTPQISLGRFCFQTIYVFRRSIQTSRSRHLQAAARCALSCSRIYVRFRGSALCSSRAVLSALP